MYEHENNKWLGFATLLVLCYQELDVLTVILKCHSTYRYQLTLPNIYYHKKLLALYWVENTLLP